MSFKVTTIKNGSHCVERDWMNIMIDPDDTRRFRNYCKRNSKLGYTMEFDQYGFLVIRFGF